MSSPPKPIDIAAGFSVDTIAPIPLHEAIHRVLGYCTEPRSGWGIYDLAAIHARRSGELDHVSVWTLLLANALNGQVTLANVADFTAERRSEFASKIGAVDPVADLGELWYHNREAELTVIVDACCFGYPGVWGPKTTKIAALFRPAAIPILDGHIANVFGYGRDAFSTASPNHGRRGRIDRVVRALGGALHRHRPELQYIRAAVEPTVPEIVQIPDLRLLDIVAWTAQDDRMPRRQSQGPYWINRSKQTRMPLEDFAAAVVRVHPRSVWNQPEIP